MLAAAVAIVGIAVRRTALTTTCLATGQYDAAVALQQAANYLHELNLIVDLISL
jgi:hypothetical protein